MEYKRYIAIKKFVGQGICGDVIIPRGTLLDSNNGFILYQQKPICTVTSQNAYEYFVQNSDGKGFERGELIQDIIKRLKKLKKNSERNDIIWAKIWKDTICLKYKHIAHNDYWLWNYDFYNADINDLKYIRNLIMKG